MLRGEYQRCASGTEKEYGVKVFITLIHLMTVLLRNKVCLLFNSFVL